MFMFSNCTQVIEQSVTIITVGVGLQYSIPSLKPLNVYKKTSINNSHVSVVFYVFHFCCHLTITITITAVQCLSTTDEPEDD
jgi:hypothetical protein